MAAQTLSGLLFEFIESHRKPDAFLVPRFGSYQPVSTETFARDVRAASCGLIAAGMAPGDRVAIISESRYEWAVADFAILAAGAVTVPIYPTQSVSQTEQLLRHSGARAAFLSDRRHAEKAAGAPLELTVFFDASGAEGPTQGRRFASLAELAANGRERDRSNPGEHRERASRVAPDDLATLVYTSGTSGAPKGVMLSHRNIVSNADACLQRLDVSSRDVHLSLLPLSHVLERTGGQFAMLRAGATIAYAESVGRAPANLAQVRPTILVAVPRFFDKAVQRIEESARAGAPLERQLFAWAKRTGIERVRAAPGARRRWDPARRLADDLVFRKVRARFGGRIRFLVSGGAPLARETAEVLMAVGLPVLEGYGLTETSPVLSVNSLESPRIGTAGRPLPGVEIAIAADGEILARGPNVMMGYHGDDDATRAVLHDGWFSTGDIGHLDEDGYLVITDRKKDLIVTAGGKNVAPQPIEMKLETSPFIAVAALFGDGRRFITALLFPDFATLDAWASASGASAPAADLVSDERVLALFREEIDRVNSDLAPFERIRRFTLVPEELSIEGGSLTPTLKVRRSVVAERYRSLIEEMYAASQ